MDEIEKQLKKKSKMAHKVFKELQMVLAGDNVDDDIAGMAVCMLFGRFLEAAYESNTDNPENVDSLISSLRNEAMRQSDTKPKTNPNVGVAYR